MAAATEVATTSAPEPGGGRAPHTAAALTEDLYARHHRLVAGLCRALLRDPAEAEDAAQQAFLSAHRALLNGAEPREPAAWLAAIARNECRGRVAARMREPLPTDAADTIVGGGDPVVAALRRADLAALWRAISALPPAQRDALLLREFGGLRYDELAAALAVTESAVESLLVRARTRLRSQLKAAYAALTGGAWLEWLARVATGSVAPAAAAKAVTLGVGAAAVTSGAVVVPHFAVHHRQLPREPAVHTTTAARRTPPPAPPPSVAAVVLAPKPVAHVTAVTTTTTTHRHRRHREREQPQEPVTTVLPQPEAEQEGGGDHVTEPTTTTTLEPTTTVSHEGEGHGGDDGEGGRDGGD
jgi:RNA polymerase sigma-70 factor, ECF subfamily